MKYKKKNLGGNIHNNNDNNNKKKKYVIIDSSEHGRDHLSPIPWRSPPSFGHRRIGGRRHTPPQHGCKVCHPSIQCISPSLGWELRMPKADQEHNPPDMDRHGLLGATDHPQKKRGSQDLETLFNTLIISGTFMSRACYSYMKPIAPTPPHGFLWGARLYFIHQGTVLGRCRSRPRARSYHQRKCIFLPVTNGNRWPSDQRATPDGEFPRLNRRTPMGKNGKTFQVMCSCPNWNILEPLPQFWLINILTSLESKSFQIHQRP